MIIVCNLYDMPSSVKESGASHMVSLIQSSHMPDTPADPPGIQHLKIAVDDITEPMLGMTLPREDHVADLIDFVANWNRRKPIVVHCHLGISRSMAAALTLLSLDRPGDEVRAGQWLRRRAAHAQPNRLMVSHADALLGRNGRMLAALDAMGPAKIPLTRGPVTQIALDPEL